MPGNSIYKLIASLLGFVCLVSSFSWENQMLKKASSALHLRVPPRSLYIQSSCYAMFLGGGLPARAVPGLGLLLSKISIRCFGGGPTLSPECPGNGTQLLFLMPSQMPRRPWASWIHIQAVHTMSFFFNSLRYNSPIICISLLPCII